MRPYELFSSFFMNFSAKNMVSRRKAHTEQPLKYEL